MHAGDGGSSTLGRSLPGATAGSLELCANAPAAACSPRSRACTGLPGGNAPASATIQSNLFDVTWRQQVSSQDLLRLNPGAALLAPGAAVALPCYPPGKGLAPAYFGGSVAYLQFTGGNQRPGSAGLEGAMAASGTNDHRELPRPVARRLLVHRGRARGPVLPCMVPTGASPAPPSTCSAQLQRLRRLLRGQRGPRF